eukprot:TRINITY_DN255_c0_g1_i2.p1 TRINITY_DN255_c0_g1~~TRINITY_DN255_c0_g1_i2.p1  ORF type:complete len:671 (+),score=109.67 TRINITY_DN255_c0_g1_i2:70-2082(+)
MGQCCSTPQSTATKEAARQRAAALAAAEAGRVRMEAEADARGLAAIEAFEARQLLANGLSKSLLCPNDLDEAQTAGHADQLMGFAALASKRKHGRNMLRHVYSMPAEFRDEEDRVYGDIDAFAKVGAEIARGANGAVFLAKKTGDPAEYVIKSPIKDSDEYVLSHARLEAQLLMALCVDVPGLKLSPNVVEVFALKATKDGVAFVMEKCEYAAFDFLVKNVGFVTGNQRKALPVLQLIADVAAGLNAVHHMGYVHGDLKPENVLVALRAGVWVGKLADFGAARNVRSTTSLMADGGCTPGYVPPEARNKAYAAEYPEEPLPASWFLSMANRDYAQDVYAFGVTALELLAGWHFPPVCMMKGAGKCTDREEDTIELCRSVHLEKALATETAPLRRYIDRAVAGLACSTALRELLASCLAPQARRIRSAALLAGTATLRDAATAGGVIVVDVEAWEEAVAWKAAPWGVVVSRVADEQEKNREPARAFWDRASKDGRSIFRECRDGGCTAEDAYGHLSCLKHEGIFKRFEDADFNTQSALYAYCKTCPPELREQLHPQMQLDIDMIVKDGDQVDWAPLEGWAPPPTQAPAAETSPVRDGEPQRLPTPCSQGEEAPQVGGSAPGQATGEGMHDDKRADEPDVLQEVEVLDVPGSMNDDVDVHSSRVNQASPKPR